MGNNCNLLIVDDDISICETMESIFTELGYGVTTTTTGEQALNIITTEKIDAAFVDLSLPDMNGIDLIAHAKKNDTNLICFVITGNASVKNAVEALQKGVDDYFVKPVTIERVLHSLNTALEKRQALKELELSKLQLDVS